MMMQKSLLRLDSAASEDLIVCCREIVEILLCDLEQHVYDGNLDQFLERAKETIAQIGTFEGGFGPYQNLVTHMLNNMLLAFRGYSFKACKDAIIEDRPETDRAMRELEIAKKVMALYQTDLRRPVSFFLILKIKSLN